jgi:hypothetical protein
MPMRARAQPWDSQPFHDAAVGAASAFYFLRYIDVAPDPPMQRALTRSKS